MRSLRFLLLVMAICLASGVKAQSQSSKSFNDIATFDLKGNVKKCISDSRTYEFAKNGKYRPHENEEVEYNEKGRIFSITQGTRRFERYEYDSYGRIEEKFLILSFALEESIYDFKIQYNSKGNVVKENIYDLASGNLTNTFSYSDYQYDSHGNWVSRKRTPSNGKIETETRSIEYY